MDMHANFLKFNRRCTVKRNLSRLFLPYAILVEIVCKQGCKRNTDNECRCCRNKYFNKVARNHSEATPAKGASVAAMSAAPSVKRSFCDEPRTTTATGWPIPPSKTSTRFPRARSV